MVSDLLADTDPIALLQSRCLPGAYGLIALPPPVPGFALHMAWHNRQTDDPALHFVAESLTGIIGTLPAAGDG